ncbi:MAG: response regulator transcription factor [Flavobacteriales bacterium]|nr:response regulator transcription factor [Flavobacteriales bacterium]
MKKIKLVVVDDRDIIRDLLILMFKSNTTIEVVGDACNGNEAIKLVAEKNVDVVIMDINMPDMDGLEATKIIKALNPKVKILCNSFLTDVYQIKSMLDAGASGYIRKGEVIHSYIKAIETIHNGGVYLSDEINDETYNKILKSYRLNGFMKKNSIINPS